MTLRRKLAIRYGAVVAVCLGLLAGLAHHEFVVEPCLRRQPNAAGTLASTWREAAEVFFYSMIPVVLGLGWWSMRRTLNPINELARRVERIDVGNLREPFRRTGKGDEVDRLTEVFNNMAARLDQSFQQVREFTLHASHELKTPLTVMQAELETRLADSQALPEAHREWARAQLDEVQRLARIVDSLTLLTKADAGLIKLNLERLSLDELVRECFEDAQILAEPHGVTVTLAACDPIEMVADRHRLRQLLLNLADNAVKYNQPGGTVRLALHRSGEFAELKVANTGPGIPPDLGNRVFERFVRGVNSRHEVAEGCGLGLTICQWIVQAHGGSIQLSTGADRLTTALVRLPLKST